MALEGMPRECPSAKALYVVEDHRARGGPAMAKYWYADEVSAGRAHDWLAAMHVGRIVLTREVSTRKVIRESINQCGSTM